MVKFESMWPSRKFRGQEGYMFTADKTTRIFMKPSYGHNGNIKHIEFELHLGPTHRIETRYFWQADAKNQTGTNKQVLQLAANWVLTEVSEYLHEKEAAYRNHAKVIDITAAQYRAYPGQNEN